MDVGVVEIVFADGVVGDVGELVDVVGVDADAVFVVAWVPDLSFKLLPDREGEASLNEMDGLCGGFGGGEEDVEVVGQDGESVEEETGLGAVTEEGRDHQLGVRGALEKAMALMRQDGDGVGLRIQAHICSTRAYLRET